MAWRQAQEIMLSENQQKILTQLQTGTHIAQHFKQRAEIVLMASKGYSNNKIERMLSISGETITKWRNRYAANEPELTKIEVENPRKLRSTIEKVLSDEQRSGRNATFTDEQIACIIAMSCQKPDDLGLPFSHWTPELLKDEAIKKGIVSTISTSQVRRFLKREGFKAAPS
jgi:putative transposase